MKVFPFQAREDGGEGRELTHSKAEGEGDIFVVLDGVYE